MFGITIAAFLLTHLKLQHRTFVTQPVGCCSYVASCEIKRLWSFLKTAHNYSNFHLATHNLRISFFSINTMCRIVYRSIYQRFEDVSRPVFRVLQEENT